MSKTKAQQVRCVVVQNSQERPIHFKVERSKKNSFTL